MEHSELHPFADDGRFPLTGAAPEKVAPPVNPYAVPGVRLLGAGGPFTVRNETTVGRDPNASAIVLAELRVSGVHATLRADPGGLLVRDEGSNNGTWVQGARIEPHTWIVVPIGAELRFGPIQFIVAAV